jgi:hypothetical protein
LAEVCINSCQDAIEWVDRKLPGGYYVTGEMAEAVQVYIDYVRSHILAGDEVQIEHRFDLSSLSVGVPMFGTADCGIYMPAYRKLVVADYKHGAGIAVEAVGNPQLRYYALGAMMAMQDKRIDDVSIVVVQPRAFHPDGPIRSESITSFSLLEWAAELVEAAKRTQEPDAPLSAGDHCRFCPAHQELKCPLQNKQALAVVQNSRTLPDPDELAPDQLAYLLEHEAQMTAYFKAARARAYRLAQDGNMPGYKLVAGKEGNRTWADEDEAAGALVLAGVPEEDLYTKKLLTPAAAARIVGKKAAKDLEQHVYRKPGVPTLVPESDKRPAIEGGAAADFVALSF